MIETGENRELVGHVSRHAWRKGLSFRKAMREICAKAATPVFLLAQKKYKSFQELVLEWRRLRTLADKVAPRRRVDILSGDCRAIRVARI